MAALWLLVGTAAGAAEPLRILALGDSLTAGYGLDDRDGFPVQLEQALNAAGVGAQVINGGVSGDTTAGGLARLDWALADRPQLVIVEFGANDALRGIDPATTAANLDAILARLRSDGRAVLLAGMRAPPNLGAEYASAFNAIYPTQAERHGVALYPFFLDGVAADRGLNQHDGIHPNAAGVQVIVRRILPQVLQVIGELPTAQGG
ncbi:MAG: arylesterase [Dongiaceae bacterium]